MKIKINDSMTAFASGLQSMKTPEQPVEDGGAGSGNWGHKGRPGKRGGSGKGGGAHYREGSKESGYKARMLTPEEAATKFGSQKGATAGGGRGAAPSFAPKPKQNTSAQPKPSQPQRQPRMVNGQEVKDNPTQQRAGDFVFEQTGIDLNKYRQHPAVASVEHALGWDKANSNGIVFDWKGMSHNEQATLQRLAQRYGGRFELQDAGSWAKTLVWKGDKPSEQQPAKPQPSAPKQESAITAGVRESLANGSYRGAAIRMDRYPAGTQLTYTMNGKQMTAIKQPDQYGVPGNWKSPDGKQFATSQDLAYTIMKNGGKFSEGGGEEPPATSSQQPKTPRNSNSQQNKQFLSDLKSKSAPAQQRAEAFMDKMKNGTTISIPSASGAPIELEKRVVRENGNYTARWIQKQGGIYFGTLTGKRAIDVIRKNGSNIAINEPDTENNTEFR